MPAYVILDVDVTDAARYEEYKRLGGPTVAANGGKYIVRGGRAEVLEGDWKPGRLVILEFPSMDQAKAWVNSEEYAPARAIRHAAARTNMVVVEGGGFVLPPMTLMENLAARSGRWIGINVLQDPKTDMPENSPATATIVPLLDGRFVRLDYTWEYQGKPQQGSLLIGSDETGSTVTANWIDTWHMGRAVMACTGSARGNDAFTVLGSYTPRTGPDWGWEIGLNLGAPDSIELVMFNISPHGTKELATQASYSRG